MTRPTGLLRGTGEITSAPKSLVATRHRRVQWILNDSSMILSVINRDSCFRDSESAQCHSKVRAIKGHASIDLTCKVAGSRQHQRHSKDVGIEDRR